MANNFEILIARVSALAVDIGNAMQLRGFKAGGTAGQVPVKTNGTDFNWSWGAATAGTVTSVSVTTANGVSGSVATATTTPAITLTLGAITPTSVNGNTITTGTGTLTLGAGKTLTVSNTLTLAGTDGSTLNVGTGGTLGTLAYQSGTFSGNSSGTNTGDNATNTQYSGLAASKADDSAVVHDTGNESVAGYKNFTDGIQFGGTTSGYPMLRGSGGTALVARLADDSGDAPFTALSFSGLGTGLGGTASGLSIGGSAGSLTTPRTINGVSFNGSANIGQDLQTTASPTFAGLTSPTVSGAANLTIASGSGVLTLNSNSGNLTLQTGGFNRWGISANHWVPMTSNSYDVGASGATVRSIYVAASIINSGTLAVTGASTLTGGATVGLPAAKAGGKIFQDFVDGASVSVDGTEDTLATHTLVANTFATNGDMVSGFFQITIVGHAVSTDRIRLYCAGTAIFDTAALNFPLSVALTVAFEVVRVSSTVLRATCFATTTSATVIPYSQYTEITGLTLSSTQILALKDISTGTNSAVADVTMKLGRIDWHPAA